MIPGFRDGGFKFVALLTAVMVLASMCGLYCTLFFGRRQGIRTGLKLLVLSATCVALATGYFFPGAIMRRSTPELVLWIFVIGSAGLLGFFLGIVVPTVYERLRAPAAADAGDAAAVEDSQTEADVGTS